jgi:hypothetical protein
VTSETRSGAPMQTFHVVVVALIAVKAVVEIALHVMMRP